jgi:branched-chain amino acid transport system permease protein
MLMSRPAARADISPSRPRPHAIAARTRRFRRRARAPLLGANDFVLRFLAEILIFGIAVMSLDILVGFGGLVSLGHAAIFGGAAYAAASSPIASAATSGSHWPSARRWEHSLRP